MPRANIENAFCELSPPDRAVDPDSLFFLAVDPEKCDGCGECRKFCPTGAIVGGWGLPHEISHPAMCLHCGICLRHCPRRAIYETCSWLPELREKLREAHTVCVAMPAPAVRFSLGEAFGFSPDHFSAGKMRGALKRLGFSHCWDLEFGADITIWEEGSEFLERLESGERLPQFSSCCPSWQKYAETFYPDLLPNLSSCKSPMGISGRLAKSWGAKRLGREPAAIYTVAITPCTAKKYEALRPDLASNGLPDIDAALTVRELAHLLRMAGLDYANLADAAPENLMGMASGAGPLFCSSGGVSEAVARYAWRAAGNESLAGWDYAPVSKKPGLAEYGMSLNGRELRFAVVQGARFFQDICGQALVGKSPYHFVEFMACPGGCLGGAGQPLIPWH